MTLNKLSVRKDRIKIRKILDTDKLLNKAKNVFERIGEANEAIDRKLGRFFDKLI